MSNDPFVSVAEACATLGVSESTIWRMIRRGALRSMLRDGRRLVAAKALDDVRPRKIDAIPPLTPEHPIFRLVGAGRGGGVRPGAADKHAILDQ